MTTTRAKVSATKRMSWLIAMTVRPGGRQVGDDPLDAGDAAGVLPGRRFIEDHDRRLHRQDRCQGQQFAPRVAEVVRVGVDRAGEADRLEGSRGGASTSAGIGRGSSGRTRPRTGPSPRRSAGPGSGTRSRPGPPMPRPTRQRHRRRRGGRGPRSVGGGRRDGEPASTCRCRSGRRPRPVRPRRSQVDAVQRTRAIRIDEADAVESSGSRQTAARRGNARSSAPATRARIRRSTPRSRAAGPEDVPAGPSSAIRPSSSDDPLAQPVEKVGLVLDDEQGGPARGQLAKGRADQTRAFWVELGGRLVEHEWAGRMASSEAITTSWAWPPDSRRGSRSASARCRASRGPPWSGPRSRAPEVPGSSARARPPRRPCR